MSTMPNAPLIEVIFEMKWGKTIQIGNEVQIEFSQEELGLMPGKFQVAAQDYGFSFCEVLNNQPPLPHLVKYRFRKEPDSYPLYQLGNGILAINQTDIDGNNYDWDIFREDIRRGLLIFEKSSLNPINELPLIDVQLRYRDILELKEQKNTLETINNSLMVGKINLPTEIFNNPEISDGYPKVSLTFQIESIKPKGQIICQINEGKKKEDPVLVIDFTIISKFDSFSEISIENICSWCEDAKILHRKLFDAMFDERLRRTFS